MLVTREIDPASMRPRILRRTVQAALAPAAAGRLTDNRRRA
jgi:hypothetical protein